ncbi:MAG: hypothetical protein ACJ75H_08495 [Thermoanaerobaculia bacterium]
MKTTGTKRDQADETPKVRRDRGYTVTSNGKVVVDVDRLLRSEKAKEAAAVARRIVELTNRIAK